ncbi:MAG: N-6 DNA methylase [Phycisphaerales bacterium]|nr:N-6 DNA methylase [Planctomycetota bacterium]
MSAPKPPSGISFAAAKAQFDVKHVNATHADCIVPVRGKAHAAIAIRNTAGQPNEEFYKWQFINAIVQSGLYPKDYIGVEVHFPKGNKGSAALKLDAAIFDDPAWVHHYNEYWSTKKSADLEWLNEHLVAVAEFKKGDKEIEKVFTGQVKAAMREKEPADAYVLGIYYDTERLYLFQRKNGTALRYDESKNQKGEASKVGDLSLHLPDAYAYMPSLDELKRRINRPSTLDRSTRCIADLDVITSIASVQIQTAFSDVLRALDKAGLVNQRGYAILIQTLALKIFDEKRNEGSPQKHLEFYAADNEAHFHGLAEKPIQAFIARMQSIRAEASTQYRKILKNQDIDWKNQNHVRSVVAICRAFQDYSFVRSAKSDLYQLVFYNFANSFKRDEAAQFLTPLPVIDFIVKMVNPRDGDTVLDPCCGIGDFLSLAFVNAAGKNPSWRLDDANIYGVDLDENMVTLATLNMLLNGDGEAKLFDKSDKGSILSKIEKADPPKLVDLIPASHAKGDWDEWPDGTELLKFDVVLTNPPFGEDRAYRVKSQADRDVIEMYETWHLTRQVVDDEDAASAKHTRGKKGKAKSNGSDALDLGIIFLENAYRSLKDNGRLGIVLSNSIASINKWVKVRQWLMEHMRMVAFFDLPSNVFAETGVNTSILIAYKPKPAALKKLNADGYSIFVRDIHRVGYEKRTSKRNVFFNPTFKINEQTFEIEVDQAGNPVLDEEFSETLAEFRQWALGQEEVLQKLFLQEG